MKISDKFKQWKFDKKRLEAFSDGVFAIVITLLVLDLKVPHIEHANNALDVWNSLVELKSVFFSWLVSFFFVALIWLHHHSMLSMATKSDYGMMWINILLLFLVCLLPFPTSLMAQYPCSPLIVMFWGLTFSATTFVLTWLYYYITKNYLKNSYDYKTTMKNVRFSVLGGPTLYLAAALLAFVSVYISFVIYALVPFLYILPLDKEVRPSNDSDIIE